MSASGLSSRCFREGRSTLKQVLKSAAASAVARGPFKAYYGALLAKGMRPEMARLTVARKIAAITLRLWKNAERFDAEKLMPPGRLVPFSRQAGLARRWAQ